MFFYKVDTGESDCLSENEKNLDEKVKENTNSLSQELYDNDSNSELTVEQAMEVLENEVI